MHVGDSRAVLEQRTKVVMPIANRKASSTCIAVSCNFVTGVCFLDAFRATDPSDNFTFNQNLYGKLGFSRGLGFSAPGAWQLISDAYGRHVWKGQLQ
jgi:hypothetical protein